MVKVATMIEVFAHNAEAVRPVSTRLKRFLFFYITGLIIALQASSAIEYLAQFHLDPAIRSFLVVSVLPLLSVAVGFKLLPPGPMPAPPLWAWVANMAFMFLFWAGGYFLVGALSYSGEFYSMAIPLDGEVPFRPEWVFIYLTVYPIFLLSIVYLDKVEHIIILDVSQFLALLISYLAFIVYPVAIERPPVEGHSFATWALSIVQAKDPPWNCFPSTHCTTCTVAALALVRSNPVLSIWAIVSTLLICLSTIMTKQHFILDAVCGVLLGSGIFCIVNLFFNRHPAGRRFVTWVESRVYSRDPRRGHAGKE